MRRTAIILSLCVAINLVPAVLLSVEPPRPVCGSAMAARLDKTESDRLWMEQAGWRRTNEKTWWQGVPSSWR